MVLKSIKDRGFDTEQEKPRIAVIDDEQRWLKTFQRFFRNSPYSIDTYSNPEDFVETIARHPDRYVGIICDIKMPQMDGHEVFKAIKKNRETRNIPFLIVSGVLTQDNNLSKVQGVTYVSKLDENLREKIFEELIDVIENWPKVKSYLWAQNVPDDQIDFFFQFYINYHTYFSEILDYVNEMEKACVSADGEAIAQISRQCHDYMKTLNRSCMHMIGLLQENPDTTRFIGKVCARARTSLNMIQMFQMMLAEAPSANEDFRTFLSDCQQSLEKIIIGAEEGYNLRAIS